MGALLNNENVGHIGLKNMRESRELTVQRWDKIGLLEGLDGEYKANMAVMYENQLNYLKESTDAANDGAGAFETVAFPMIRRIFSKLLANDIVSIQSMSLPIGRLYFINPKVSVRQANGSHYSPDGAYGNAAQGGDNGGLPRTEYSDKSLYDSFYATDEHNEGDSLYDVSKGKRSIISGACVGGALASGTSAKSVRLKVTGVTEGENGKLIGPRGNEMDTEAFLSSLEIKATADLNAAAGYEAYSKAAGSKLHFRVVTQKYGQAIVNGSGEIELEVFLVYAGLDGYQPFTTAAATTFEFSYNRYADLEQDSEMGEVTFEFTHITVSVETRKLRTTWTPEVAQDVHAFHSVDAEAELTALLSEQVAAEIDREILRDLRRGAAWVKMWDYNGMRKQSQQFFGVQKDWNQTLVTIINQIDAQIHKSTLRGGANFIVVSPEVSAVFNDLEYFHVSNAASDQDKYSLGIEKVGTLANRFQVYRDPYAPAGSILIGHKGTSIFDAGYIYASYVPLQLTPKLYNHNDFKSVRGIMTRYAKKMVNNRFYGRVIVDGLPTMGIGELA